KSESDNCKHCNNTEKKQCWYDKMSRDVQRWLCEGNRPATVERTLKEMQDVMGQILRRKEDHDDRLKWLG
ncbi:hypothetical protein EDB81DRAFT_659793, partial [Dactylonectria macrodidyma]